MAQILVPESCSQCTQQFDHLKRNLDIKIKCIQTEFNEKLIDFVNIHLFNYLDNIFEDLLSISVPKLDHIQEEPIKMDSSANSVPPVQVIESPSLNVKVDEGDMEKLDETQLHNETTADTEDEPVAEATTEKSFGLIAFQAHHRSHRSRPQLKSRLMQYVCDICPKTLTTKTGLITHRRTHTRDNNWHECDVCRKSFAQKNTLIVHMRTHTNERPFMCHYCSRTFNQPSTFKRHMLKHDGIKPFKCTLCERAFVEKTKLAVHMLTHTGERPHVCPICKRGYTKKYHVKKHVKNFHNIVDADSNIRSAPFGS